MKKLLLTTLLAALPLAWALGLNAQGVAVPANLEPGITRQQADQILNELRLIRQLLEQQAKAGAPAAPQPPKVSRATLNMEGVAMLGSKDAPLTIVEYTDYQCPFCQRFHVTAFNELKKAYIDTGKVRFYSRDLPLDFHPNAMRAALAARCAGEQGQFWKLRDIMGANPDKLDIDHIVGFAADLKIDAAGLRACVVSEKYKSAIEADLLEAMKVGAQGTPTFVLGKSTATGVEGEVMEGAMPFPMFDQKLKELSK
ncbi:MAG TPA: thioredoxin domain-containing protein [Candidatus Acidoferrales bacterium]|nr:thioredoxin domain-containing protein [Candidatus Acidoferrales bacterium]